ACASAVGVVTAAATGGATALLFYAGRKTASIAASAGAGALTTSVIETYDKTIGKKSTKEAKERKFVDSLHFDISGRLDEMHREYRKLLEKQAEREKKRLWIKAGVAALVGLSTGIAMGAMHHEA